MLGLIALNLRRRRSRTLLTAIGIAVGVGLIVALLSLTDGLKETAKGFVHLGKADLSLFQRDAADPTASVLPPSLLARVRAQPGVADATPVQLVVGAVPGQDSAIVFGADPKGFAARRLVLTAGRHAHGQEVLLGDDLAQRLGLGVGTFVPLNGRPFRVAGIYHSGVTFEDTGAVVSLPEAQSLAGKPDTITTIAVTLRPQANADDEGRRLENALPGTVALTDPNQAVRADVNNALISKAVVVIALLALVIGAIMVTNTMIMAVLERQTELALLSAVGWSRLQVAGLILGEGVGVSLIGVAIGLGLGIAADQLVVSALSASAFVSPEITAWGLGRAVIVGLAIGILGGLYPAWRVTRIAPAKSLARA